MRLLKTLPLAGLLVALGCAGSAPPAPATALPPPSEPSLRPGDQIHVAVWQEEDLTGEFPVAPDGTVVLPLLGDRKVTGIGIPTLEAQLRSEYGEYLENPSISVRALRRVSILGQVRQPGLQWIDATISLTEALAMAGGVLPSGDPDNIQVVRDGTVLVQSADPNQAIGAMPIQSGDQIHVGERGWLSRNTNLLIGATTSLTVAVLYILYR